MLSWLTGGAQKLPVTVGDKVSTDYAVSSWWQLHEGKKKSDNSDVSIFVCDLKANSNYAELAKNAYKRMKTLRHPYVLSWIDGHESDDKLTIITECVKPLSQVIDEIGDEWTDTDRNLVAWGCYQVAKALAFLNTDCKVHHGNINIGSIFVTQGGDWKIGGLDFISTVGEQHSLLMNHSSLIPSKYVPPELAVKSNARWQTMPPNATALDAWQLGCALRETFGGPMAAPDELSQIEFIPDKLQQGYQRLLNRSPAKRLSPKALLDCPFFNNPYVKTCLFLENLAIKDSFERDSFFKTLPKIIDQLPASCCRYKLLPEILHSLEFAGTSNWNLLAALIKVAAHLPSDEYDAKIAPVVVKYFKCNDRTLRITLLQNLDSYIGNLKPALVDQQLFPAVAGGFSDSNPQLRELTVKSMLHFAPKLSTATIDSKMLSHFAKLQVDKEPGIRTNTTICLGRVATHLEPATRKKILASAFARSLRDPFPPGRIAGLASLCATMRYYDAEEIAKKVLPAVCSLGVDTEKSVRDKAFATMHQFVSRLEHLANGLPETKEEAERQQAEQGMLGWLSKRIYGKESNESNADVTATQENETDSNSNTEGSSSSRARPEKKAATSGGGGGMSLSAAKPAATRTTTTSKADVVKQLLNDGWDDDDQLDGVDDTAPPADTGNGWEEEFSFGDEDDDDDDGWDFTPAKTVESVGPKQRRGTKKGD
mmetsp:Transcript_3263/g.5239  ORF Transcript_3263/g.5239 Transcript_3263/m.5239 type:complete len:709 (+) Transcript_3263:49-2175(+)